MADDRTTTGTWARAHRRSLEDPEGFWGEAAGLVDWITAPASVLDDDRAPFYRWFSGGVLNTCYNALDRHVIAGRGDQVALIHDSPVTGSQRSYTYAQLLDEVARFGGVLRVLGVEQGDRVVIYMPMVPQAAIAMLACARIGAVHSVVFGGFAPAELAARIDDARPVVVVTASCGIEPTRVVEYKPMLDAAIERAEHKPSQVVVLQRPAARASMVDGRDVDWDVLMRPGAVGPAECVPVAATDPLYVLYTSGTTGRPKGILRDNGGHAVALTWSMRHVFGLDAGDTMFTASDVGWVVGHSYIVYGPLLAGCTTVLFEGKPVGTPDAGTLWRVAAEHGASVVFTAPTAIRAVRKADPDGDARRRTRPVAAAHPVPRGGAPRPRHLPVGDADPRGTGRRQLVADRDRVADRRELPRPGSAPDQARVSHRARAGVRRAGSRPGRRACAGGCRGCGVPEAAAAARNAAHPLG